MPVSVIMPALNAGRFIEAAIRSLLREREAVDLDIIVIDDGSSDETRADRGRHGRRLSLRCGCSRTRARASPRPATPGWTMSPPSCRFVTFLDADDISYPGRIERQRSLLVDDPTIDVLYGVMRMFNAA